MSCSTRSSAPGLDDRPLQRRDLRGIQLGIPDQLVDDPPCRGSEPLARVRDEDRALALAQVVARGLAGRGLVAEDAEHVIAQLERHADRMPERRQRGLLGGVGAGERRTDRERLLDAVARGLERRDAQRALGVHARRARCEVRDSSAMSRNWPIVTSRRIVAYSARADAACAGGCRGQALFEKVVAPRHQQVAEQDRARPAEGRGIAGPARARDATPRARGARRGGRDACRSCRSRRRARARRRGRPRARPRPRRPPAGGVADGAGRLLHCPPPGDAEPPAEALAAAERGRSGLDEQPRFGPEIGRLRLAGPRGSCPDAGKSLRRRPERVTRA